MCNYGRCAICDSEEETLHAGLCYECSDSAERAFIEKLPWYEGDGTVDFSDKSIRKKG